MRYGIIFIFLLCSLFITAQNSTKIKDLEKRRKEALAAIEETSKLLSQTKTDQTNVLNHLNLLTQQISSRKEVISLLNQEISSLDQEVKFTELNIQTLEKEINIKKDNYTISIRKMRKQASMYDKILFILSADNFAQSYRRLRYLKEYAAWQKLQASEIIDKQKDLVLKKGQLAQSRRDKMTLLKDRESETLKLKHEEDSQKIEISNLKKQEKTLQTELDQKKKQAQELNRQIEKAIAEEIAKAEKDAQKDAASNKKETRVAETKGGYAMTKAEKELSSNFADNKGKLPYPLKGKYQIIGHFGQQQHQDLKYVKTNNNGIDIQTTSSTDALSVFDGEVTRIFVVAGYNNSVIVRHGNYLTVYSNLSEVYIKAGTKVKTGQSIGKIFTDTEDNNSTILHFEIWKERDKLNPEVWLN